jgi:hypothetical protein
MTAIHTQWDLLERSPGLQVKHCVPDARSGLVFGAQPVELSACYIALATV